MSLERMEQSARVARGVAAVAVVMMVFLLAGAAAFRRTLPESAAGDMRPEQPPVAWPEAVVVQPEAWSAMQAAPGRAVSPGAVTGAAASRFRLAGTFVVAGGEGPGLNPLRKAILDDLAESKQHLVGENETVGALAVRRIFADRVLVEWNGRTEELSLAFKDPAGGPAAAVPAAGGAEIDPPALEHSRFGKRVGETRWVLDRDSLMEYYRELLDEPERVVKLYDTFKPIYSDEGRITGYRIGMEGEQGFLKAVGLAEGDVVREVNSLKMTSQSRAEFFIGEFAKGRMGAVVMDIERGGKPAKLVYLIR